MKKVSLKMNNIKLVKTTLLNKNQSLVMKKYLVIKIYLHKLNHNNFSNLNSNNNKFKHKILYKLYNNNNLINKINSLINNNNSLVNNNNSLINNNNSLINNNNNNNLSSNNKMV